VPSSLPVLAPWGFRLYRLLSGCLRRGCGAGEGLAALLGGVGGGDRGGLVFVGGRVEGGFIHLAALEQVELAAAFVHCHGRPTARGGGVRAAFEGGAQLALFAQ